MAPNLMNEKYEKLECIGDGAFGLVNRGRNKSTGEIVAMKHVSLLYGLGIPGSILREICLLKHLKHPNIIELYDVSYCKDTIVLVFEYMNQHLGSYLETSRLDINNIQNITSQILKAVNFCHKSFVFHRDLKPENILINQNGDIKISDFGLSRMFGTPSLFYSNNVVTLAYRAPDIIMGSNMYGVSVDLWSLGCILGEILNGGGPPLFSMSTAHEQLKLIFSVLGAPDDTTWPGVTKMPYYKKFTIDQETPLECLVETHYDLAFDLLKKFLKINPQERIRTETALEHEFFKQTY